jgi:hypothetical protein
LLECLQAEQECWKQITLTPNPEAFQLVTGDFRDLFPESSEAALITSLFTLEATLVVDECQFYNDRDIGFSFGFSLYNNPFAIYLYITQ